MYQTAEMNPSSEHAQKLALMIRVSLCSETISGRATVRPMRTLKISPMVCKLSNLHQKLMAKAKSGASSAFGHKIDLNGPKLSLPACTTVWRQWDSMMQWVRLKLSTYSIKLRWLQFSAQQTTLKRCLIWRMLVRPQRSRTWSSLELKASKIN